MSGRVQVSTQPTVEAVEDAYVAHCFVGMTERDWECAVCGPISDPPRLHAAHAVLALLPGRSEAVAKAEALREAAAHFDSGAGGGYVRSSAWLRAEADRIEAGA